MPAVPRLDRPLRSGTEGSKGTLPVAIKEGDGRNENGEAVRLGETAGLFHAPGQEPGGGQLALQETALHRRLCQARPGQLPLEPAGGVAGIEDEQTQHAATPRSVEREEPVVELVADLPGPPHGLLAVGEGAPDRSVPPLTPGPTRSESLLTKGLANLRRPVMGDQPLLRAHAPPS